MAQKQSKRETTKYRNIYYNVTTKKYDVKYNYSVYDPLTGKNKPKAKWKYNCNTITEARQELALLQTGGIKAQSKDITLEGAVELWKLKAEANNYSKVTINNTDDHMAMIYQFIPKDFKVKDITEDIYYKFCSDIRKHGYSEETLYSLNSCFRKLINLCYKKKLITDNPLHIADNMRTEKRNNEDKLIEHDDYLEIKNYFKTHDFIRLGVNNYPLYEFLFCLLYYSGIRIGESLALRWCDFEEFSYYSKREEKPVRIAPSSSHGKHLEGLRVIVDKAYVSEIKLVKSPKNLKHRKIPLHSDVQRLYYRLKNTHLQKGGDITDRIFNFEHGAVQHMLEKACKELGLQKYTSHCFRHTFISNLIRHGVPLPVIEKVSGDTQVTILERYSSMFESDELMILNAFNNL